MSIFGRLFGSSSPPPPSNDLKKFTLIREILRLRLKKDPLARYSGVDPNYVDSLDGAELLCMPEGSLVTILESYAALLENGVSKAEAITRIEAFRFAQTGIKSAPSENIFDYATGRLIVDHPGAEEIDIAFLDEAICFTAKVFGVEEKQPQRQKYELIEEVVLDTHRIIFAKNHQKDRGYTYPFRLMAYRLDSEKFDFSYNLEVTPLSCCLGSHGANGSHLNFGTANASMSLEEFTRWAYPLAIKAIYKDRVLSDEELHHFAVNWSVAEMKRLGFTVTSTNYVPTLDPQIWALEDNNIVAVLVRAKIYPFMGQLDLDGYQGSDLFEECENGGSNIYQLLVSVSNADADNDFRQSVLLRDARFNIHTEGLKIVN